MSERQEYYKRRFQACLTPDKCLSTIGDGMAQVHNLLPHLGFAGGTIGAQFDTHLQVSSVICGASNITVSNIAFR
jgi:hypothetical protein